MRHVAIALVGVSGLAFLLAVIQLLLPGDPVVGVSPEGFSRTSSNLALIAIALGLWFKESSGSA